MQGAIRALAGGAHATFNWEIAGCYTNPGLTPQCHFELSFLLFCSEL